MAATPYTDHLYCDTYPYITPEELIACCKDAEGLSVADDRILEAIDDASTVLYYLTGKQFAGTCRTTVRPGCLSGHCMCGCSANQVELGVWPVTELISVRYGGVLYTGGTLTDFHINDRHYLARDDGAAFLSGNQYAVAGSAEDIEANGFTFEVTVDHGIQIPGLLKRATRALACQFVAVCCDKPCKLPERVTSIARSGISMDIASVTDLLIKGRTGVYQVDLAIQVFNPSALQSPSFIWHPQSTFGHNRKVGL